MIQHRMFVRVETPMFIGGFTPSWAEWRTASIKGVLRYWYRAIQPDLEKEKEIFGSANRQSMIRFHLDAKRPKISRNLNVLPSYFRFFLERQKRTYIVPRGCSLPLS